MGRIMSYKDNNHILLWKRRNEAWDQSSPLNAPFDPEHESYCFNTFFITDNNKTLFFAKDDCFFGIKIIESTNRSNNFQLAIAPVNSLNPLPEIEPNLILSSQNEINKNFQVPFQLLPDIEKKAEVYIINKYKHDISLIGNFNGGILNSTIPPITQDTPHINLGILSDTLNFSIVFSDQKDIAFQCMVSISIKGQQPLIVFFDRKGYSDLSLEKNDDQPGTINITIEPDIP